ncbi:Protein CBG04783 [Caenorhabditis briggsae]|uniref:Protein CBG04783 n=1 Tax=Caenorhabditis briggsae TaxID=6238 RepID=A8WYG6_CAEBR|nr:Protein CBG04783 [Caenorhabditis briggsae]CAP25424.2 Protein CBG04783 [Caenorhabditis briggsae]
MDSSPRSSMVSYKNNSQSKPESTCSICGRPAICRNYGAFSCNACKMFFKRTTENNYKYHCDNFGNCRDDLILKCRFCRFQKCVEVGMINNLVAEIPEIDGLSQILNFLIEKDSRRCKKLSEFYSTDDPTLEDILENRNCVKKSGIKNSATLFDWSFVLNYLVASYFLDFDFISELPTMDKFYVLKFNTLKLCLFVGAMRAYQSKWERVKSPDGRDYNSDDFLAKLEDVNISKNIITSRIVRKIIQLKITNEEFVLLCLIFFCDTGTHNLSEISRSSISSQQNKYGAALFKYCQRTYQKHGPSRFTDLLSICHVVNKNTSDLQFLFMAFQSVAPGFKFKKLIYAIFDLPGGPT